MTDGDRRKADRRSKAPAFQFYAKDWLVDTARMTLEQEGAFIRLIGHQWIEGPLPSDPGELARILGVGKRKFASLWRTLCKHFPAATQDTVANERLELERQKQADFREKCAKGGRRSVERRLNHPSTTLPRLVQGEGQVNGNTAVSVSNTTTGNPDDEPIYDSEGRPSAALQALASELWPGTRGKRR